MRLASILILFSSLILTCPLNAQFFNGGSSTPSGSAGGDLTGTYPNPSVRSPIKVHGFGASFSGSDVANAKVSYGVVPFACTIAATTILTDATALTFKVWKIATGTAVPTVTNVINTSGISLSSGTAIRSTTLTDFTTTSVSANDIFAVVLSGVTGSPTFAHIFVECNQ